MQTFAQFTDEMHTARKVWFDRDENFGLTTQQVYEFEAAMNQLGIDAFIITVWVQDLLEQLGYDDYITNIDKLGELADQLLSDSDAGKVLSRMSHLLSLVEQQLCSAGIGCSKFTSQRHDFNALFVELAQKFKLTLTVTDPSTELGLTRYVPQHLRGFDLSKIIRSSYTSITARA